MKTTLLLLISFIGFATAPLGVAAAPTTDQIEAFSARVKALVAARDFEGIKALYYLEGTPPELIAKTMMIWQARVTQDLPGWTFTGVEYFPFDELLNRPGINQAAIRSVTEPKVINGVTYVPNTPIVGMLSVNFTEGLGGSDFLYPVGISPAGELCFVEKKRE